MKIALQLEDGPDGLLKMRRFDLDGSKGELARQAVEIAQAAVTEWMWKRGQAKEADDSYEVKRHDPSSVLDAFDAL